MQIDLQSSFLVGSAMALVARDRLPLATERWVSRARMVALAIGGAVFAPAALYVTLRWTGWGTMYLWDRSTVPTPLLSLFPVAVTLSSLLGFHLTCRMIRAGRRHHALLVNGLVLVSCLAVVAVGWDRVGFVGTLEEYAAGGRANLLQSDLAPALGGVGLLACLVAVLVIGWLRKSNHEA
jgi:hypothetical protein